MIIKTSDWLLPDYEEKVTGPEVRLPLQLGPRMKIPVWLYIMSNPPIVLEVVTAVEARVRRL
jgi:hypothetical protein